MGEWRVVKSLLTLRDQINALAPGRSKASDGTIGDAAHQAGTSDHNPAHYSALGPVAVVCALDVTQDPAHGADMGPIAEALRKSRDRRIGYVIFNHRITGPNHGWAWDPYSGSDPHTNHMHVSAVHTAAADDASPWRISSAPAISAQGGLDMLLFRVRDGGDRTGAPAGSDAGAVYLATADGPKWITGEEWGSVGTQQPMLCPSYARIVELCPPRPAAGAVKVDAAELAAAMLADPGFASALAEAAFQGAQRAEGE